MKKRMLCILLIALVVFSCTVQTSLEDTGGNDIQKVEQVEVPAFVTAHTAKAVMSLHQEQATRNDRTTDHYINLALNKPVKVSSMYGPAYDGVNLVDDDETTVWGSMLETKQDWLYVDLQRVVDINGIGINWFEDFYARRYEIYISNDLTTWTHVYTTATGTGGFEKLYGDGQCRYIGLLLKTKNKAAYAIKEFAVYKEDIVVTFADANLEAYIRYKLRIPERDLLKSDLDMLQYVTFYSENVSDLGGLEHCEYLTYLSMNDNQLSNLDPIKNLERIDYLSLSFNNLTTIEKIASYTKLRKLFLRANQLTDISCIANYGETLTELDISKNTISDISALANLKKPYAINIEYNNMLLIDDGGQGTINLGVIEQLEAAGATVTYSNGNLTAAHVIFKDGNLETEIRRLIGKPEGDVYKKDLEALTILDLKNKGIADITNIKHCINLTELDLSGNQITQIPPGTFTALSQLTSLNLSGNGLTTLDPGIFNGLTNLNYLMVYNNEITTLKKNGFKELTNLDGLYISGNPIATIESDAFAGLAAVTELSFDNHALTVLKKDSFLGLSGLKTLYFSAERDIVIEPHAFNGLSRVTDLYMRGLRIADLQAKTFMGLTILDYFDLSNCTIKTINGYAFEGITYLDQLNLSGLQIENIHPYAFWGMRYLEVLTIENNPLTTLNDYTFSGLINLTDLKIKNNPQLTTITEYAFSGLSKVDYMQLQNNALRDVDDGSFRPLSALRSLNVTNNNLSSIEFVRGADLTTLWASDNELTSVNVLGTMYTLNNLSFRNNSVQSITALKGLYKIGAFYITGNNMDVREGTPNRSVIEIFKKQCDFDHIAWMSGNITN